MRRDTLFFCLFKQSPTLLFELLEHPPENAAGYRFDSVAVKEAKFEIDGIFLPPASSPPGIVFACEVQFQFDPELYEHLFAEFFVYLRQNRQLFSDWQAVVIYPSRKIEQPRTYLYRSLLGSEQVHRIYLDELGDIDQLPLGLALMVLTTLTKRQAPKAAKRLVERAQTEAPPSESHGIIEMITTIMVYRFTQLSREEIQKMLGVTLQETRVYQEAKEEGRLEGEQIGELRGEKRGEKRGRLKGERELILRQLSRRCGQLPDLVLSRLQKLTLAQLSDLGDALLDFQELTDLEVWLQTQGGD
jgi:predicted transposase/invertase (TIGR01784 family)